METVFNDGNGAAAREVLDKLRAISEYKEYERILNQLNTDPHIEWGEGLNVLLISDRAPGRAEGLRTYMNAKANFQSVCLCQTIEQSQAYLNCVTPDIIIFVGMADNNSNYQAIDLAKKANPFVMITMFAFLDDVIKYECCRYQIPYAFSSQKPLREGLLYLRQAFENNMHNM
jgi:hypothetical protein